MSYFPDLSTYVYQEVEPGTFNIGWLDADHRFPTWDPPPEFTSQLTRLVIENPVRRTRGWHDCPFCRRHPATVSYEGAEKPVGDAEIRVQHSNGRTFAAPTLIAHYVAQHRYQPPEAFIAAVEGLAAK
jgi:hypothetical protein